ncbi:hypothetical protein ANTRET_LOCUS6424 [Anthophora retusa]
MGTMRNNFAAVFVPLILMLSTSQSLPVHGHGNSSKRNSLPDTLTPEQRSTSPTIHKCLFIDPDLPNCDEKWMLSSEEDTTSNEKLPSKDVAHRSRRNVDVSTMDVIVYTIEGCLPLRLPFSMPSCNGISLDRIVDVEKFRPFMVKGVTKPPFVFPEFNYPRWLRMMTRLRNHVSSKTRDEEKHNVTKKTYVEKSTQGRTAELMKEATMKETIPNAMAVSMKNSKGSSLSKLISEKKSVELPSGSATEMLLNTEKIQSSVSTTLRSPVAPAILKFHQRSDSKELRANEPRKRFNNYIRMSPTIPETAGIPKIPTYTMEKTIYEQSLYDTPSNDLQDDNSRNILKYLPLIHIDGDVDGIERDYLSSVSFTEDFKRKREIRLPSSTQGIVEDTKTRGIAGKSASKRLQSRGDRSNFKLHHLTTSGKSKKQSKSLKIDEHGIAAPRNTPMLEIPPYVAETDRRSVNKGAKSTRRLTNNGSINDGLIATPKETTTRKKYQNHVELLSSRWQ